MGVWLGAYVYFRGLGSIYLGSLCIFIFLGDLGVFIFLWGLKMFVFVYRVRGLDFSMGSSQQFIFILGFSQGPMFISGV